MRRRSRLPAHRDDRGWSSRAPQSVPRTRPRPALMLLRAFLLSTRRAFAALLGLVLIRRSGRTSAASTNSFSRARASARFRSEEHTSELQPLMRLPYADFSWKTKNSTYTESSQPHH